MFPRHFPQRNPQIAIFPPPHNSHVADNREAPPLPIRTKHNQYNLHQEILNLATKPVAVTVVPDKLLSNILIESQRSRSTQSHDAIILSFPLPWYAGGGKGWGPNLLLFKSAFFPLKSPTMTKRLEQAIAKASGLSDAEQDAIAEIVLAEIESERKWDVAINKTPEKLGKLADKAWREHRSGQTDLKLTNSLEGQFHL
jgi:hypothetical protein